MAEGFEKYDEFGLPLITDAELNSRLNKLTQNFDSIFMSDVPELNMSINKAMTVPPPPLVLPPNGNNSGPERVKSSFMSPVPQLNVNNFIPKPEKNVKAIKNWTREWMWDFLERNKSILCNFPRPCHGEIPNFMNAKEVALQFSKTKLFENSKVVLVSPSISLTFLRELMLRHKKVIYVRQNDMKENHFLWRLDANKLKKDADFVLASTARGLKSFGKSVMCRKKYFYEKIDLVVVGSVAVNKSGARIDTGMGQSDLEWAILYEIGAVDVKTTTVATLVDCVQILEETVLPNSVMQKQDLPADVIVTRKSVTYVKNRLRKPDRGVLPHLCSKAMLKKYPAVTHFI